MDGAFSFSEKNSNQESSSSPTYRNFNDIYLNGNGNKTNFDQPIADSDIPSSPSIIKLKNSTTRIRESNASHFSLSEFPALSTSPNGIYADKMGSFLGMNYLSRPVAKSSSFKIEKEDFPALPQGELPEVGLSIGESRSVLDIANSDPKASASTLQFSEKYGLLGLIQIIKAEQAKVNSSFVNRNCIDFGTDCSLLDLETTKKPLFEQVLTPFYSNDSHVRSTKTDPPFTLPRCFAEATTPTSNLALMSDDSLFYAFYFFCKDSRQLLATKELYGRGWKFYIEDKLWVIQKDLTSSVIAFDKKTWKKVAHKLKNLKSDRFLSVEELNSLLRSQVVT